MKKQKPKYIQIDNDSRVKIDDNNYTLELLIEGDKEAHWEVNGYFPTLESLLVDWVTNAPTRTDVKNLKEVVGCIKEAQKLIINLIK
jgi:hypothetical protein